MEKKSLKPYVAVLGLMVLTSLALAFSVDLTKEPATSIRVALPDRVGEWIGQEIRYCQNPECGGEFFADHMPDPEVCPSCGEEALNISLVEKNALPPDTEILKMRYRHPAGRMVYVSIVLSGRERDSIHRPQLCLVGQGFQIERSRVVSCDIEGRNPLDVMLLDLIRPLRTEDGRTVSIPSYYAYWFVGKERETPYHLQRMFWMATDRIFRNVVHQWAYIAVSSAREKESDAYVREVESFVAELYPHMYIGADRGEKTS